MNYFELMKKIGVHTKPNRYKYYYKQYFRGYDFKKKRVLDIGGGIGQLSFYAAASGAESVVCLEPENAGCTSGVSKVFEKIKKAGDYRNANIIAKTFQEYFVENVEKFDIIVSNASINHLDEDAIIDINSNAESRYRYKIIAEKIYNMLNTKGTLIIADIGPRNLFNDLGLKSPICKTIEWHKHQNPRFWKRLFEDTGFILVRKEYQTFNVLKGIGKILLGNFIFSYIYGNLFILEFKKP